MKKSYLLILAAAMPGAAIAQSAIDALQVSPSELRGTARFMSMGGAFTALGGDLSTLNQNPAGIGIYRSSEVGATLDIDIQHSSSSPAFTMTTLGQFFSSKQNQTKVSCNNFGYVGSTVLDGALKTFNWGVTYNRAAIFDRIYQGYAPTLETSLSNYIAAYTTASGYTEADMNFGDNYNPYLDSDVDWLSTLAYNSYLIQPTGKSSYSGLFTNGTNADALYTVRETGGIDEYNISFGGNVENVVYWGLSVGITDLHYTRTTFYSESLGDALIYNVKDGGTAIGSAGFDLTSRKYINGTGANIKLGVIVKPINELRFGLAVHTPTWYTFTQGYDGQIDYAYTNPGLADGLTDSNGDVINPLTGMEYTEYANFNWRLSSPWRLMVGVAGVINGKAIVSLDYQYDGYNSMRMSTPVYSYGGYIDQYESNAYLNSDIKDYYKASNTVRLGVEYRITPQFSVRAGYNVQTTNVKSEAADGILEVLTSGTDPSYTFDKTTQYITCGLGYRYKQWYIDAAYVHKHRESTYHAFTDFDGYWAPTSKITDNNSQIVLSTGFKF